MKRNETKPALPVLKTSMNSENNHHVKEKRKKKKKNIDMNIPLHPKNQNKSIENRSNMTKVDNNLYNSTAVDSEFSKRDTDLTDMRSIDYSTVRGSSKGSSQGSTKPVYKLNYKDKMRRVDEKQ